MARVFSGIQPSGELHIGNYLGAVQNWVKLQHQHDCLFCVVDRNAITQPYEAATLAQRTIDMAIGLFAAGIDPGRAIVFVQSHVPEHTELYWHLNTVTPLGELERQTQFKDKAQRQESVPAGLLNYPVLQAADVLLYEATLVPVGEDQLQHLELMREIDRKSTRLNSSHITISYAVFCLKKKQPAPADTPGQPAPADLQAQPAQRKWPSQAPRANAGCARGSGRAGRSCARLPAPQHCARPMYRNPLASVFFFFNATATTEIYTLSLHDALPISPVRSNPRARGRGPAPAP